MSHKLFAWRDWKIATKLSLLLIAATFLGLAGFTLAAGARARSDIIVQARIRNLQRARATAQLLDFYLDSVTTNVQLIAVAPGTQEFMSSVQHDVHREDIAQGLRFAQTRGRYDAVFLLDPLGNVLIATDARVVGRNYTSASWFRNATAGRTTFDEPRYDAVDGKVYLHVSAPVTTPGSGIVGVAVARLTLEPIDNIIAADVNYDGRGAFGVLQDVDGIRLSNPLRQDVRFKPSAPLPPDLLNEMIFEARYGPDTAAILGNPTDFTEMVRRGKLLFFDSQTDPYLSVNSLAAGLVDVAMAPLKNKRWIYGVAIPQASLLAEINQQAQDALLQAMVIALIALVVSYLGARWITRPIRRVAESANALASGDLTRRVGLKQRDEVGQLAATFDAMAEALEQKDATLSKYTAQLEDTNKELEAFSYSVSHDLRSPLRAIGGFSRILAEDYQDQLDTEGKRLLNVVQANVQKMDQLISELLALSRVTQGELTLSRIDMTALAQAVYLEIASAEAQSKFVFSVASLPNAFGDEALMRQVWSNLISNAIKYSMPKDECRIEIGSRVQDGMNVYCVRDNGVGYNPDYAHKLFGAFQRLHKAEEFEGNGVGLAIVQRIVHRHGGRVWAEGQVNQGATFYFALPQQETGHEPTG